MELTHLTKISLPAFKEYGVAIGTTVAAVLVRFSLDPYLGVHLPYVTFFVAVAVTTWYGGLGASLTAVILGGLVSVWFFTPPRQSLLIVGLMHQVGFATYFMVSLTFVGFGQALRRTRLRAEKANMALRQNENRLTEELAGTTLLQEISTQLIEEGQIERVYEKILDAAVTIMRSDCAIMQMLCPNRGQGELRLLAFRGLTPETAKLWEWVRADSESTCGMALRSGKRVVVPDVKQCDFMADSADLLTFLKAGVHAVMTTPLVARSGTFVGMISTHWRQPHMPDERELRLIDVLARQAADLLERKRAEETIRVRAEQFETLVKQAPLGVYLVDADFRIAHVNPTAQLVFGNIPNLIGLDFDEVLHTLWQKAYADEVVSIFRHTLETGEPYFTPERTERRLDRGVIEYYEWRIDRIMLPDSRFGVVCYFRDISTLVQSREALRELNEGLEHRVRERTVELLQSQQRLRTLATELSLTEQRERKRLATELHDHLQQMLVLAKLKLGQGKRFADHVPALARFIHETDDALSDALKYTRTLVTELSPLVLRDHGLCAGLKWLGEYMKKHDLAVVVTVPEGADAKLREDQAVLLFQSVRELLINSSKHAGTHEAWVTIEKKDSHLAIEVTDKGAGFDLAAADSASGGLSSRFGLFSIRERMQALGGSIEIHSQAGQGTTAILTVPINGVESKILDLTSGASEKIRSFAGRSVHQANTKTRVLVVDDHAMMRHGLISILSGSSDLEIVGEAANGVEALRAVEEHRPAVVIMDINMPEMNGIEATTRIKGSYPEVAVIGLSVNAGDENQQAILRAGAVMLLTKEAAVEQLYGAIQEVVKKSQPSDPFSTSI